MPPDGYDPVVYQFNALGNDLAAFVAAVQDAQAKGQSTIQLPQLAHRHQVDFDQQYNQVPHEPIRDQDGRTVGRIRDHRQTRRPDITDEESALVYALMAHEVAQKSSTDKGSHPLELPVGVATVSTEYEKQMAELREAYRLVQHRTEVNKTGSAGYAGVLGGYARRYGRSPVDVARDTARQQELWNQLTGTREQPLIDPFLVPPVPGMPPRAPEAVEQEIIEPATPPAPPPEERVRRKIHR